MTDWREQLIDSWDRLEQARRQWDAVCGELGLDDAEAVAALERLGAFDDAATEPAHG
jgi:hypothetical protein